MLSRIKVKLQHVNRRVLSSHFQSKITKILFCHFAAYMFPNYTIKCNSSTVQVHKVYLHLRQTVESLAPVDSSVVCQGTSVCRRLLTVTTTLTVETTRMRPTAVSQVQVLLHKLRLRPPYDSQRGLGCQPMSLLSWSCRVLKLPAPEVVYNINTNQRIYEQWRALAR